MKSVGTSTIITSVPPDGAGTVTMVVSVPVQVEVIVVNGVGT